MAVRCTTLRRKCAVLVVNKPVKILRKTRILDVYEVVKYGIRSL